MKLVLLSGGSGKRLWPISNDSRSKQFLKVLKNNQGKKESMVQRVWRQLKSTGLSESTIIATSKAQIDIIQRQLNPDFPIILEPERRDTFPSVALAATYLYSVRRVNLKEIVAILPVDLFVNDVFFYKMKELESILLTENVDFALMGVVPTFPSEKYGYIVPERNKGDAHFKKVEFFQEKPSQNKATELITQGAYWNCGVTAFQLEKIISLLVEKGLPIQYDELMNHYKKLPKVSFDYEVLENSENIVVLPYKGYWKDLGTWNTLTEEMATNLLGKGIISDDSINTHVLNELDIPVAVLGLSNVVVAVCPDGILITDKAASPRVKEIAQFNQRLMYEEKIWGWYRVLDYSKFEDKEVLTKRVCVRTGMSLNYQMHFKRSEVWTIIKGEGEFVLDDQLFKVKPGDVLQIPLEAKHGIRAISELEFIQVQTGSEVIEDDIFRLCNNWEELLHGIKNLSMAE